MFFGCGLALFGCCLVDSSEHGLKDYPDFSVDVIAFVDESFQVVHLIAGDGVLHLVSSDNVDAVDVCDDCEEVVSRNHDYPSFQNCFYAMEAFISM